jgi:hypothetical protein
MTYKDGVNLSPVASLWAREERSCLENVRIASSYPPLNVPGWRLRHVGIRHRIGTLSAPRSCCTQPRAWTTRRSQRAWTHRGRLSVNGASASSGNAWRAWRKDLAPGAQRSFPPSLVVAVKALAGELPYQSEVPLSRWSLPEIRREVIARGMVPSIGESTLWRWLTEDAIRPWSHRSWIFPRAPDFERKASRVLDLYAGRWQGTMLSPRDCVVCADEKTSVQARRRCHATLPTGPARPMRVEHEYDRLGAWSYLAWGRAACAGVWTLRARQQHCRLRSLDSTGHDSPALSLRTARVLDHGQTAALTEVHAVSSACRGVGPTSSPYILRCMRAGSTKSRSTSPSCSARPSRRTTFAPSANSSSACSPSRGTTRGSLDLFNGDSHDAICAASCSSSTPLAPGLPGSPDGRQIPHRTFGPEY